jgi:hypothetical protein
VATDQIRLAVIERDRTFPVRELQARVEAAIERWRGRWAELDDRDRDRRGEHPTQGTLSVAELANRFVASHLEDHLDQLAGVIGGGTAAR